MGLTFKQLERDIRLHKLTGEPLDKETKKVLNIVKRGIKDGSIDVHEELNVVYVSHDVTDKLDELFDSFLYSEYTKVINKVAGTKVSKYFIRPFNMKRILEEMLNYRKGNKT